MGRYVIKPEHRGRKKTVAEGEPTKSLQIALPLSLWEWARKKGPKFIRTIIAYARDADQRQP